MKNWIINNKLYLIGAILGALGGYLYWKFVGCVDGSCAITSNALHSTLYFGVSGLLLASVLKREKRVEQK